MPNTLTLAEALALLAFVALALAIFVFFRRASRLVADSREAEQFRTRAADLMGRLEATIGPVSGRIDDVRHHRLQADAITEDLASATTALEGYSEETRALAGPRGAASVRDELLGEIERLERAIQMVEHGCSILGTVRSEFREPEAQTSIKRGYLNIQHARESIGRLATRAAGVGEVRQLRLFARRRA
jgi:hypothetical protein